MAATTSAKLVNTLYNEIISKKTVLEKCYCLQVQNIQMNKNKNKIKNLTNYKIITNIGLKRKFITSN